MSKPATTKAAPKPVAAKPAAPKPRAAFAAASFANLRAAAGEGQGEPLRIKLVDIDEDPDQPRKVFDQAELESFAEAIRLKGVLQPVGVRPAEEEGRYLLVFGARRFRASRMAGLADIPAVITGAEQRDYATQVMENQQRANLSNSDLAAAVAQLSADGNTNKQVAAICNLKDYQVAALRQVPNFPPFLAARLDTADIRALYDLFRQWDKTPAEVEAAMPGAETYVTVTEARRIIGGITGKPTGSIVLDRAQAKGTAEPAGSAPEPALPPAPPAPQPTAEQPQEAAQATDEATPRDESERRPPAAAHAAPAPAPEQLPRPAAPAPAASAPTRPVFVVAGGDGQSGRLVTDRRAEQAGWVLVAYETGIEEVEAASLRFVAIE